MILVPPYPSDEARRVGSERNLFLGTYQMLNFEDVISNTTFLLAAADGNWLTGFSKSALSIIQVILGLGFVIFVHELGHFLAAKFFGVKCEKFYVGFDVPIKIGPIRLPASLGKFQWVRLNMELASSR